MSGFVVTFEVLTLSDLKTFSIQFSLLNNDRYVKFLTTIIDDYGGEELMIICQIISMEVFSFVWFCNGMKSKRTQQPTLNRIGKIWLRGFGAWTSNNQSRIWREKKSSFEILRPEHWTVKIGFEEKKQIEILRLEHWTIKIRLEEGEQIRLWDRQSFWGHNTGRESKACPWFLKRM